MLILLVLLVAFSANSTIASDERKSSPVTEKNVDRILKSVDTENKTLTPEKPENEFQALMAEYMKELKTLELEHQKELDKIGPIEFSSFDELSQRKQVLMLRGNIEKYWECRKNYFDRMDKLLKKYRTKTGKGTEYKGRLEGTAAYFMEKLEEKYVKDITAFYDFVLDNHNQMIFKRENILMQDQYSVDKLNQLWEKAIISATELTTAREKGSRIMLERVEQLKEEKGIK